ncbi:hypothetical protein ACQ4PT_031198 [Festuca glaucescens]
MAPVELRMDVHCSKCVKKIRKAVENLRGTYTSSFILVKFKYPPIDLTRELYVYDAGVSRVWASPEQGLVVVHGTADAYALRRRIERKMERPVEIVSDSGSAPYYYPGTTAASHYGPPQLPPPPHAYYSHPPPVSSYPYAAGGYGAGWADPDPYGYAAHSTVSSCSIM